jgi:hypothetical protein
MRDLTEYADDEDKDREENGENTYLPPYLFVVLGERHITNVGPLYRPNPQRTHKLYTVYA